jgi:hypothetical protein
MKCTEAEKQIDSFIDDELSPSLADKVELHLKECRCCKETFDNLQTLRRTIRKDISVPDSSLLDGRVLKAFSLHHGNKQKKNWRAVVFGQIVISKPAFATALLLFAVFTGLAFQFGKMTATDVRLNMPVAENINLLPQMSETNFSTKLNGEFENKIPNAPIIKFIEVPVVKEKIVTRIVYVYKTIDKTDFKADSTKVKSNNLALNSSVNENRYSTQVDLKQFQPVAEMKTKITKKDANYEK